MDNSDQNNTKNRQDLEIDVKREDINRLFEVVEQRAGRNPEIVIMEMLRFARKYIPDHPNAQANTLRDKLLADAEANYEVINRAELQDLRDENDLHDRLLVMQHERLRPAEAAWQKAHDKPGVLPDLGTLGEWLMAEINRLRKALEMHKHTDECLRYAAQTGKAHCIAECRDSYEAALKEDS